MPKNMIDAVSDKLPESISFDRVDKIVIVGLIAVFLLLFVWLLSFKQDQPLYAYLTFLCLLTLVFVGILRAVGVFRTPLMALGGAAAVFAGLFFLTEKFQNQTETINKLTCVDPACNTLRRYFDFLQHKQFPQAIALWSDSWKQTQEDLYGSSYPDIFASFFKTTKGYSNFGYVLKAEEDNKRQYSVSYDVRDDVPGNTLYDKYKQKLSALSGSFELSELPTLIMSDLQTYYAVPEDKKSGISNYLRSNVTVGQAFDPFFIIRLVTDLKLSNTADLQQNSVRPPLQELHRHFVHRIMMAKEKDDWKILSVEQSLIWNYP